MKKILLSVILIYCSSYLTNAQVIDLAGVGVLGKSSSSIDLQNIENIEKVSVMAFSKGLYDLPPSNGVLFDNGGNLSSAWSPVNRYGETVPDESIGYYSRSFDNLITDKLNATISIEDYVHSFQAYIHRNMPESSYTSFMRDEIGFVYSNGSTDPFIYNVDINTASEKRNIKVKVPITELADDDRVAIIEIDAGGDTVTDIVYSYNLDNSFFLGEYDLLNVGGEIDKVIIKIYSPTYEESQNEEYSRGGSFFVSGVVVDVDKVYDGCTLTQGYWKNHSDCPRKGNGPKRDDTWDKLPEAENSIFFSSGKNYCEVFATNPGKGGKYYILAHQYMATQLNLYNNTDPKDIKTAYEEATQFLNTHTPEQIKGNKSLEDESVRLGGILDDYNNGRIGPGHCDDDNDDEAHITPIKQKMSKVKLYPNPSNGVGKISFTPKQDGITTVDLYNTNGQKAGVLFNQKTKKDKEITIDFNTDKFKSGLYFAIIKNGSDLYKEKISIVK